MSNDFNSGDFDVSNDSDNSFLSNCGLSFSNANKTQNIRTKNIFNSQNKQQNKSNKDTDDNDSNNSDNNSSDDSDDDSYSECDSADIWANKNKKNNKKKPIKTKKMPIREAIKTVEERSLYAKIDRYFKTECSDDKIHKMIKIIENEDQISLRLLNWFAMKHSATMESLEITDNDGNRELFDVKISYRARLNTHSKKYFDPFRRGKRFDYCYDKKNADKTVETTLCQLNFFRWLFLHDLMDYVEDQFDNLKQKMGSYNNVEKKKKETKKEKESLKKTFIKNKKEDIKIKVKRFNEDNTSKLVIII